MIAREQLKAGHFLYSPSRFNTVTHTQCPNIPAVAYVCTCMIGNAFYLFIFLSVQCVSATLSLTVSSVLCVCVSCLCALGAWYVGRANTQNGVILCWSCVEVVETHPVSHKAFPPLGCVPVSPRQQTS